ncbi:hypothetical protein [Clostridium sp. CF012]|uniref:hypothetical protein n=1 Tax=Clostridium sp. CF012 TaxID=2843319 RepID=UPI001C0C7156|nr:hypothetical protein [Clostridium sp. CF012]MBU3145648.1 hypothetical protein [Clostridium sp. CF012]
MKTTMKQSIEIYLSTIKNSKEKAVCIVLLENNFLNSINSLLKDRVKDNEFVVDIKPNSSDWIILVDAVENTMRHCQDKRKSYDRLKLYFTWLNRNYDTCFMLDEICPDRKAFGSDIERQLDIIKYLQGTPKTMEMLKEHYWLNEKNIRPDLNALENGIEFQNQKIKIEVDRERSSDGRQEFKYSSTAHPVFMPLNLTQVYALTVGIKKISKDTQYDNILNDLSNWVYSQLSDYAKHIIKESIEKWEEPITFEDRKQEYNSEKQIFAENLLNRYHYYEKCSHIVSITYASDDKVCIVEGRVRVKDSYNIQVISKEKVETLIPIENIMEDKESTLSARNSFKY